MKFKVSFIDFLNSVPLGWGFLHGSYQDAFDLMFDVPSECARHLSRGEADVGLIPVIEYQNIPGLRILPDISIASKHQVKSVLFVSKLPLEEVPRIAVDASSRTSVALLKIILQEFYGRKSVSYQQESADWRRMLELYDAVLIIGNAALGVSSPSLHVYDLAREWNHFTGLPFVFAFWAVREGVHLQELVKLFPLSRQEGLREIESIARLYSQKLGLSTSEIRHYLSQNLDYSLDQSNLRGLETFFEIAERLGITSSSKSIEFYNQPKTPTSQGSS